MVEHDPIRRVVGPNGNEYFETWCASQVALCIVTTQQHEPLCEHEELKPVKKLGIQPDVLKNPAVPAFVDGTSSLATPEWELAFTESMRCKVQYEPVNAAICISHLRAIRQCLGASHNQEAT